MRAGLAVSSTLHVVILGAGLLAMPSPRSLEAPDVESFPVDIVPMSEISQAARGEREAPLEERSVPRPTNKPEPVADARNVGDNTVDLDNEPTPEPTPREVETANAPPPEPEPAPQPTNEPAEPAPSPEPAPVPATEVEPEPQPRQEVTPEPAEETAVAESPDAERVTLPQSAPRPQAKPERPKAQTAKAPERKAVETPAPPETAQQQSEEDDFDLEDVAALLNRQDASGGGALRSNEQASLGGQRDSEAARLSQSEIDGLRQQVQRCWSPPVGSSGAESMVVSIRFSLTRNGEIDGQPQVVSGSGSSMAERAAAEAARRAVLRCAPYNAPVDKYEAWADIQFNFDPSDMF